MIRTSRTLVHTGVRALLAAGVVAALAGCTPADEEAGPTDGPTTTVTATVTAAPPATPAPAATPTAADAVSLLIGPTSFSLVDESGAALGSWDYRDGTGAVAALTEAFGSAPTESDDVPYEGYRTRVSSWPGLDFEDTLVYDAGGPESGYPEPDFLLHATAPAVGDVAISTLGGVAVGDAASDVATEHPGSTTGGSLGSFLFDTTTVGSRDGAELTNAVGAIAADEVTVSSLRAPFVNWGV